MGGPGARAGRDRRVIGSGSTQATHTLTAVRVRRRSTGPATKPGSEPSGSGVESIGTVPPMLGYRNIAPANIPGQRLASRPTVDFVDANRKPVRVVISNRE